MSIKPFIIIKQRTKNMNLNVIRKYTEIYYKYLFIDTVNLKYIIQNIVRLHEQLTIKYFLSPVLWRIKPIPIKK